MSYEGLNHYLGEEDYYETLGLESIATAGEVNLAFQKASVRCEVHSSNSKRRELAAQTLARVTRAYELLSNPTRRAKYDRFLFGAHLPENPRVARFFHDGHRAFRHGDFDLAVNRLREAVRLHPHRNIYRIHLAMAYAEKGWKQYAIEELNHARTTDPDDFFALEALMRTENMEQPHRSTMVFTPKAKLQLAGVAAGFLLFCFAIINGTPQRAASAITGAQQKFQQTVYKAQQSMMVQRGSRTVDTDQNSQRSSYERSAPGGASGTGRMSGDSSPNRQLIGSNSASQSQPSAQQPSAQPPTSFSAPSGEIPKIGADQLPPGRDYSKMKAVKKTYYPQDNVVVVIYEDGAVMTYKPEDLTGWYPDEQKGLAVMVTKDRELIPAPASLPLQLPDGSRADLNAPGFPAHLFPEYALGAMGSGGESRRSM